MDAVPLRSVLYVPASNQRAMGKVRGLATDAIILDLEDAVAPDAKKDARANATAFLANRIPGSPAVAVRINALSSEWGREDAAAAAQTAADAVLIPKVENSEELAVVAALTGGKPLWAMIETPGGVFGARSIAAYPAIKVLVMGTNDLAADLGCVPGSDRQPLIPALAQCILAARAERVAIIDGVYNAFRDTDGLDRECRQGRAMGFDGKTLIHPTQINITNMVFSPSVDELTNARRVMDAFGDALKAGQGVAVLDGRIVENLHVAAARTMIDRAGAIAAREAMVQGDGTCGGNSEVKPC